MSDHKLSAGAKEWTPNAAAKTFVPGSSRTPAAPTNPVNNNNQYVNQQHQSGMNSGAASWNPQTQFMTPVFPPPYYAPQIGMYQGGAHMYPHPPQEYLPMYNATNMNTHSFGNNKHGQNGGNNNHHNHNKKNYNNHHNHSNNHSMGNNIAPPITTTNVVSDKKPSEKSKNTTDDKVKESEEPNITFGDLDQPSSPTPSTEDNKAGVNNTTSVKSDQDIQVDAPEKDSSKSTVDVKDEVKKASIKPEVDSKATTDINTSTTSATETPVPIRLKEMEKDSAQSSKPIERAPSGWQRNASVVEKTASQMLLRSDGITRYGKSQLCSMNTWGKTCPEEIKEMYLDFAKNERPPMSETTRQKSPSNHRQGGRNHGRNRNNQVPDEPHPDEQKIFSSEHLKSSELFGGGRPDKVVDTKSNEGIVSQANFILNVMTIETFDKMSDKFMKVGLDTEELMKIGVDLIVSKAQLEEHFSFMYADLCKKITDQWVTNDGEEGALGKQFRGLLLNRCQEEFEQDRELAVKAVLDLNLDKDDEEEKLLILKKRYTGHMRFVGEIYMKDMLKANKMHYCVVELLESKDENGKPDNEKLACLCKLFQTIGKKLEDYELKKKRTKVQEYFDKIELLANDKALSSKVRFGFKDLIEMRQNNWTARRVEEKAKKLSDIRKDDQSNQNTPRSSNNTPRQSSFGSNRGSQDARGGFQDARSSARGGGGDDEWTMAPTKGKKGSRNGGSSTTPVATSSNNTTNKFSALNASSRVSSGNVRGSRNSPQNISTNVKKTVPAKTAKGGDLKVETVSSSPKATNVSDVLLPGHDGEVDANTVKRIIAAFNEYYGNDMVDEIVEVLKELVHENGMWKALHATMHSVMSLSTINREKYTALLPKLYERKVLNREQTVKGISSFLHEFDDFVIDVPLLAGYFSTILANLYVHDVFEGDVRFITTLPEENDFTLSMRMMSVIVQTAVTVTSISNEDKAIAFFESAVDVSTIDGMQKEQLALAVEKYDAQYLQAASSSS